MARTTLTPKVLTSEGSIVNLTNAGANMTADDAVNGMTIPITTTGFPAPGNIDRMILLVLNTNATGRTVTIRGATSDGGATKTGAGTGNGPAFTYPGFEGGKGDLVTSAITGTTGIAVIGPFEVARHLQPDGSVSVDFSGATGFVSALILPRAF